MPLPSGVGGSGLPVADLKSMAFIMDRVELCPSVRATDWKLRFYRTSVTNFPSRKKRRLVSVRCPSLTS